MENRAADEIAVNLLKTKDSMEKMHDFPLKSMKRAKSLDSAARSRIAELKGKSVAYNQLEKLHNLKGGNPHAAGELLSSLMKPRQAKAEVGRRRDAKSKPATAFCANCGTKLTPGAAFCPNCGNKTK